MTDSEVAQISEEIPLPPAPLPPPAWLAWPARRPFAVLALLGLLLWLPGILSLPPLDRDESRFAQSSRQMVETGNPVDIRFGHVPRYKKPVGIYWLQAVSTATLGLGHDSRIWTYRVPSLLGAIIAARLTVWTAAAFLDAEIALLAGLMLLSTVLLAAEATIATTDAVLLATVVAVQGVLLRLYRGAREDVPAPTGKQVLWAWAALAIGILIKGPVTFGVAIATMAGLCAWDRDVRWLKGLRPLRGLLLTLVIVLPWLLAITIQSHGAFLQQSVGDDFAAKLAGGQEGHFVPPTYYLLLAAGTFFPAILFVAPGLVLGVARRSEPAIRFLLVWAVVWWIGVEAVPTKLPHYVLPAYPALAILAAIFATQAAPAVKHMKQAMTVTRWVGAVQFLIGAVLLVAAIVVAPITLGEGGKLYVLWVMAGVGGVLALAALVFGMFTRRWSWSVLFSLGAMLLLAPALTAGAGPRLDQLWISQHLKPLVEANSQPGDPPPIIAGYQEPSLVFALGADVDLTDGRGAAEAGVKLGGLALVEDAEQGDFMARLAELQGDVQKLGEVSGLNYSRGRRVHVTLYRVTRVH